MKQVYKGLHTVEKSTGEKAWANMMLPGEQEVWGEEGKKAEKKMSAAWKLHQMKHKAFK